MNLVRNNIKRDFAQVPNTLINDNSLSDRARFLFCYMAAKPDGWKFYQDKMAKDLKMSLDTLRKYLAELIDSGWVSRTLVREGGKFDSYEYDLNPEPCRKNTDTVKNQVGKIPTRENSVLNNTELEITITKEKTKRKDKSIDDAPKIILQTISSFYEEVKTEMHKGLSKRFEKHIVAIVLENQIREFIEYWSVREFRNSRGQKIKSLALTVATWCKNGDDWGEVRKMYDRLMGGKSDSQNSQIRYSKEEKTNPMKYDRVLPTPKLNKV